MTQQTQQQTSACFPSISQSPSISLHLHNHFNQHLVGLSVEREPSKKRNIKINCNKFPKDFFANKKNRCGSIQSHRDRNSDMKLHIGRFNHDLNQGFKPNLRNDNNSSQKTKQYRAQSFDKERVSTRQSSLKKFYSSIVTKQQTQPLKKKQIKEVKFEDQLLFKEDSQMFNCTFAKNFKSKQSKKMMHKNHQENRVKALKHKKNMLQPTQSTQTVQSIEGLSFNTLQLNMLVKKKLVSETQFLYSNFKQTQMGRLAMLPPINSGRAAY